MAFKMSEVNSWGTGALGTVTNPSGTINSYANVTAISGSTVTLGVSVTGIFETFTVGSEILLHVSAITTGTDLQYLGNYIFAKITAVNGSVLTLDKDVSALVGSSVFANHHVQILTVAQFDTLNLTASITPPAYSVTNKYGGIIAFKCKTAINYSGSAAINTVAKGIPIANVAYRQATAQEGTAAQIGWENHITARKLYMNCPDGIVFVAAKASNGSGTAARFGGTTAGVARATSQKGGPTIMWLSETITGFDPSVIAKTSSNTSGSGLARCYIATESKLPADELLYALDCLSNPMRLANIGINTFGDGSLGTATSLSGKVNTCAPVSAISSDGKTLTLGTTYGGVYGTFATGSLVVFHVSRQTGTDTDYVGKLCMAKILAISGSTVVLDKAVTNVFPANILSNYKCQLVNVAQFDSLKISGSYADVAYAYDDTAGCGGLLVLAGKTSIDVSNCTLDMTSKGIPASASRPAVSWHCSGHQGDCLPISQGNGAILLLSSSLTMPDTARVGSTATGANYGGTKGGGYQEGVGANGNVITGGPAYTYYGNNANDCDYGIKGKDGRTDVSYGGSGPGSYSASIGGNAGTSLLIIADTLYDFSVAAICTGGVGGQPGGLGAIKGADGGAGYGGGSGGLGWYTTGANGGNAATCFIYANNVINPDYTAFQAS